MSVLNGSVRRKSGYPQHKTALLVCRPAFKLLKKKNKAREEKVLDLEARSRRSNLRLVNLPEGAEGEDACAFLENWLPEALNLAPLRTALIVERAHQVGLRSSSNTAAPRTLIMKFLN